MITGTDRIEDDGWQIRREGEEIVLYVHVDGPSSVLTEIARVPLETVRALLGPDPQLFEAHRVMAAVLELAPGSTWDEIRDAARALREPGK